MFKQAIIAAAAALLFATAASAGVADHHTKMGLDCKSCHGPDGKGEVTTQTCTGCHQVDALVAQQVVEGHLHAVDRRTGKGIHFSPPYGNELDCASCHMGHSDSENFCNQCHQFDFKVP